MHHCKTLCSRLQTECWRRTLHLPKTQKDLPNASLPAAKASLPARAEPSMLGLLATTGV